MPNPPLTAELALIAGEDAANRQMRSQGRKEWSESDYQLAIQVSGRLLLRIPMTEGGLQGIDESVLRRDYPSLFRRPSPG
jgi:hypothetical protein